MTSSPAATWPTPALAGAHGAGVRPATLREAMTAYPRYDDFVAAHTDGAQDATRFGIDPAAAKAHIPPGGWVCSDGDDSYPAMLAEAPSPPLLLYGYGNRALLDRQLVGVIGSRDMTALGENGAQVAVAAAAAGGAGVITGGAKGVDTASVKAALAAAIPAVVVLATGADVAYPRANLELFEAVLAGGGAIISEQPFRTGPDSAPGFIPAPLAVRLQARNRIVAALSDVLVPTESGWQGGTMGTVWVALGLGRPVLAVMPKPHAQGWKGAQAARMLADRRPWTLEALKRAGATRAAATRFEGRSPLASGVARDRDELTLLITTALLAAPGHPVRTDTRASA